MKQTTSKEKVLKNIRDALVNRMQAPFVDVDVESNLYNTTGSDYLEESFAKEFIKANGKFVFCPEVKDLAENLQILIKDAGLKKVYCKEDYLVALLESIGADVEQDSANVFSCQASVTGCEVLIARHGTIVCSSKNAGRKGIVVPPVHIVVATSHQLVDSIADAMQYINEKYGKEKPSLISFLTGPSRTADIEKTLVHGAHGPKEVYLFLLDVNATES